MEREAQQSIRPGKIWLDTDGERIQAHGGSVITVGDTFYWYGENKEKTTGENAIWHWGVRCYSSKDLYNWKNEGIIISPEPDDPASVLHPSSFMDRPHIVYNEKTKKYVAWLKIMGDPAFFAVLTADHILGPYEMVNPKVNPCGLQAGDFDIQTDPETGKAYLYCDNLHTSVYCAELNEEYTDAAGSYTEQLFHEGPPEGREAPAHFVRNGVHYLITSGTTSYYPNPSETAVSEQWEGPYSYQGNPHVDDRTNTSFNSQISSVFKHPWKKDLYIAVADRWMPDLPKEEGTDFSSGRTYERIRKMFREIFDPNIEFEFTEDVIKSMKINSSLSDYVWLPLRFEDDKALIDWKDEWRIEDYE